MNKKIRVVHYGIGHDHSPGFLECLKKFSDIFELVGICEPNPEMQKHFDEFEVYNGVPRFTEEELFALEDVDAAIVEAYDLDLVKYAQRCADKGWHVHMDKAAGVDISAYKKLLTTVKEKGLVFQIGYMYRYNPMVKLAYEMLDKGELGEIYRVDAFMNTRHPKDKREWMAKLPGGDMLYLGCHMVDLVYRFMGMPDRVIAFNKHTRLEGVDYPDNTTCVFEYEKGVGIVEASAVEVNGYGRRQLVVAGSRGTVEIKPLEFPMAKITSLEASATYSDKGEVVVPEKYGRYDEMMLDFAAFVKGEKQNPFTLQYEYNLHKLILLACGFNINIDEEDLI